MYLMLDEEAEETRYFQLERKLAFNSSYHINNYTVVVADCPRLEFIAPKRFKSQEEPIERSPHQNFLVTFSYAIGVNLNSNLAYPYKKCMENQILANNNQLILPQFQQVLKEKYCIMS